MNEGFAAEFGLLGPRGTSDTRAQGMYVHQYTSIPVHRDWCAGAQGPKPPRSPRVAKHPDKGHFQIVVGTRKYLEVQVGKHPDTFTELPRRAEHIVQTVNRNEGSTVCHQTPMITRTPRPTNVLLDFLDRFLVVGFSTIIRSSNKFLWPARHGIVSGVTIQLGALQQRLTKSSQKIPF